MEQIPSKEDGATQTVIKTFVFLDLETSSLVSFEHPKIMEMCLIAVHREALLSKRPCQDDVTAGIIPRVLDKLTLCVYPNKEISEKSFELTKLDNYSLSQSNKKIFDADAAIMIRLFISRQEAPVCLVAHNGDRFDFRMLRTELLKIGQCMGEDVLCADSMKAYAATDGDGARGTSIRYALGEIYGRAFRGTIPDAHHAESDVLAMIQIMTTRAKIMCNWMDRNAVLFNEMELYYAPSPSKKDRFRPNVLISPRENIS